MSSPRETLSRRAVLQASDDAIRAAEQANATLLRMMRNTRVNKDISYLRELVDKRFDEVTDDFASFARMSLWSRLRWLFTGRHVADR